MSHQPFSSVLIANRGEIAVRIIRACREAGLRAIAVYSDADARALHVRRADEAYRLGPPPPAESYLNVEAILEAARQSGAEAVHPGYGFLAESAEFAERCLAAGLVWIGPSPAAMRLLGDKAAAKVLAERVGVPILPGYHAAEQDDATLGAAAEAVGYPLLVKAAAGGGGRGMRLVESPDALAEALAAARREARLAFGDDRLLLERYLRRPRHVEMQMFGDRHGTVLYLGERDCSIQRRHQKVIEEAPAPHFSGEQRRAMGEAAVALASAADYTSSGTVEFLLDEDGRFYFLEVNTRLQVEHPVTEMVTGLDLVQLQFKVAAGVPLPLTQDEVRFEGHAIECRLYAEDWGSGFLPSTGRLDPVTLPDELANSGVRVDRGVETGDIVTSLYDPLLAKIIVHSSDRSKAIDLLVDALQGVTVGGVRTNVRFLQAIIARPSFAEGRVHTRLVEDERLSQRLPPPTDLVVAAAASELLRLRPVLPRPRRENDQATELWRSAGPWRVGRIGVEARYLYDGYPVVVRIEPGLMPSDPWAFDLRDQQRTATVHSPDSGENPAGVVVVTLDCGEGPRQFEVVHFGERRMVRRGREVISLDLTSGLDARSAPGAGASASTLDVIRAPMPGRVVKLLIKPGDQVRVNQTLLVLEAMKIEHLVMASRDGVIEAVRCREGDQVELGAELVELED